jgi:hypothetical protein
MQRSILHDRLISLIRGYGAKAAEHRQVARRLRALLPERFKAINSQHRRRLTSAADAERAALIDSDWINHVEEVVAITHAATHARIEYETHLMMFEARRSLRTQRF